MIDEAALERGRSWEAKVAALSGGRLVPSSGSQWFAKGDVTSAFLFQAKSTSGRTWGETRRELRDAISDAVGTGRPAALAILDADGEELAVMRLSDLLEALSSGASISAVESNGERRRRAASTPGILREFDQGMRVQ
jgi:hypothetical protein